MPFVQSASAYVACFLETVASVAVCNCLSALFMFCICPILLPRECPTFVQLLCMHLSCYLFCPENMLSLSLFGQENYTLGLKTTAELRLAAATGALIFPGTILSGLFSRSACGCSSCWCSWSGMQTLAVVEAVSALCVWPGSAVNRAIENWFVDWNLTVAFWGYPLLCCCECHLDVKANLSWLKYVCLGWKMKWILLQTYFLAMVANFQCFAGFMPANAYNRTVISINSKTGGRVPGHNELNKHWRH